MQLFSSLLFGISSSLDALLVGISLGMRKVQFRFWQNLSISLITLFGTCLSVGLGGKLTPLLPGKIANYTGSLVLMLLGLYYIAKWLFRLLPRHRREVSGTEAVRLPNTDNDPASLCIPEILILGFTLSLNNMGMGLASSIAGLSLLPAAIATALCSILFLYGGNRLGKSRLFLFMGKLADPLSGILLILLSLVQFF